MIGRATLLLISLFKTIFADNTSLLTDKHRMVINSRNILKTLMKRFNYYNNKTFCLNLLANNKVPIKALSNSPPNNSANPIPIDSIADLFKA